MTSLCRWPTDLNLKLFLGNSTSEVWEVNLDLATFKTELTASKKLSKTYPDDKTPIIYMICSNGFMGYVSEKKVYISFYDKDKNELIPAVVIMIPPVL